MKKDTVGTTDHIDNNIRSQDKYKQINKVSYFQKIKLNIENHKTTQERKEEKGEQERTLAKQKIIRWEKFRKKRLLIMDKYLKLKRR